MSALLARRAGKLVFRLGFALISAFLLWGLAYALYLGFTKSGSYRTDFGHVREAFSTTLGTGQGSVWPHLLATLRRALLVSSGSLLIAISLGPVFAWLQKNRMTRLIGDQTESLLETLRAIPITMLFVLLAFSMPLGSEITYILIPLPVTTAILASAVILALKSRSKMREHFYRQTFQRQTFFRLTLPEVYFSILSDLRQTLIYSVLLVVVLEYVQQPLSGFGVGTFYFQLFATPPSPEMVFAMALPPLAVVSLIAALILGAFDLIDLPKP